MKLKRSIMVIVGFILFFTVATVGVRYAKAEPKVYKMVHTYKKGNLWAHEIQIFGDNIERVTKGEMKFEYYYGGTLTPKYSDMMSGLVTGAYKFGNVNISLLTKYDPRWNILSTPGVIWGWEHWQAFEKTEAYNNLAKDLEKKGGLKMLYWGCSIPSGDLVFNSKRPLVSPADWKGLKIRTSPAESTILLVKSFGASPIVLSSPEVGTALSQGVVDGGIISMGTAVPAWSGQKTAPFVTIECCGANLGTMMLGIAANVEFWNSLSQEMRETILDGCKQAQACSVSKESGQFQGISTETVLGHNEVI